MKLSQWAKKTGVSYRTAWRWFRNGTLPVVAEQMPTGTIVVKADHAGIGGAGLYARVSSFEQKNDLDAQLGRLASYAAQSQLTVVATVAEIGSGLNGRRPKLMKLLADPAVKVIVVEHRDRLMRFGVEYVESALAAQGRRVVVVNEGEVNCRVSLMPRSAPPCGRRRSGGRRSHSRQSGLYVRHRRREPRPALRHFGSLRGGIGHRAQRFGALRASGRAGGGLSAPHRRPCRLRATCKESRQARMVVLVGRAGSPQRRHRRAGPVRRAYPLEAALAARGCKSEAGIVRHPGLAW